MKLIEKLSDKISEEICDGKHYVKMALEYRDEYPELGRLLYNLSLEEMDHMNRLHGAVVDIIESYRKANGEPPANMLAVYDYLNEQQIEKAAKVKHLQTMYKEG